VLALVGSKDWNNTDFGKVNMVTTTRQPGSSFKPIVYGTGVEERDITPAIILDDKATDFNGYQPRDYTGRFYGNVTARFALANSLNVPAVLAMQKIGVQSVMSEAKQLGVTTLTDTADHYGLPLALGSGPVKLIELTNVYATFANTGQHNDTQTILNILDKNNNTIFSSKPQPSQVVSAQTSFIISSMLSDNAARAPTFGNSLNLSGGRTAAVKTGTTEDYRDALTIGYTPSLTIGVWIGNNDNTPMSAVAGSSGSGPIWKTLMQQLLAGTPNETFQQPDGVVALQVCRGTEAIAPSVSSNTFTEYFRASNIPSARCNQQPIEQPRPQPVPEPSSNDNDSNGNDNQSDDGSDQGNASGGTITPGPTPSPNPTPTPTPVPPPGLPPIHL
jgi:membrane carboxypeptidase/penicillin-binding protein PbpC